jgi:hypothetical protein
MQVECKSPEAVTRIVDDLLTARARLAGMSVFDIVAGIDAVARDLLTHPHTADEAALFSQLKCPALRRLLEEELGDPALLDGFRPRRSGCGQTRAFGPRCITHILPGNVPDIAVMSLVSSLLVKSACLIKLDGAASGACVVRFLQALSVKAPPLAACCALVLWGREQTQITQAAFERAEVAVVYGSDETIAAIRPLIPPQTRALFHGHKVSFGVIARESITPDIVERAATDIVPHDQRGCLSPHLYYVESGGAVSPLTAASWLAEALSEACRARPAPSVTSIEAARIWQWRGSLPLSGGHVFQSPRGVDWTVLYDPDPTFAVSPLGRTVWVKPVSDLRQIPADVAPMRAWLQAIGIAISTERAPEIVAALTEVGVGRICPIGAMQRPPLTWHHDGRFRLLDFLRFVDDET